MRFLRLLSDGTDLTPRFAPGRAANEDLIQWHVRPLIAQLGRHTLIAFRFQRFSDALRIATRCVTLLQNNPHVIRERLAKDLSFARSAVTRAPKRARPATMQMRASALSASRMWSLLSREITGQDRQQEKRR